MIYHTIGVSIYSFVSVSKLFEVGGLHQHCSGLVAIAWIGMECCSYFLRILIALMYFKGRNWISKTLNCMSCLVVCKIAFCSEFLDIPENACKVTRRRRRRTRSPGTPSVCFFIVTVNDQYRKLESKIKRRD